MWDDPKVVSAVIAAITSILTLLLTSLIKSVYERKFHIFKLEAEHRYEQRKKIKEILSSNKIHLINACESPNHRMWNFSSNHTEKWHCVDGEYTKKEHYYFHSFVYRVICVYAWIKKIENEMVYLDTTIATKEDLELIKFLRVFPEILCDLFLVNGLEYDANHQTDHLFTGTLDHMACSLLVNGNVCDFSSFQANLDKYIPNLEPLCKLIECMSPDEERYRWDRFQILHYTIIAFLNAYGYDFQVTRDSKLKEIIFWRNQVANNRLQETANSAAAIASQRPAEGLVAFEGWLLRMFAAGGLRR